MRMCKTISFNSWNNYFKAPFGALKVNEGADIKVIINDESVYSINLIIEKEDENLNCYEVKRINLEKEDDKVYKCKIEPLLDSGIYYYYFEVEVNRYGQNQKLFFFGLLGLPVLLPLLNLSINIWYKTPSLNQSGTLFSS